MAEERETVATRDAYNGKMFRVRVERVVEHGRSRDVEIVLHGDSLAVAARPTPHTVILVRQYRYPASRMLWEIPAGTIEDGEAPEDAARRELREETGYGAGSMRALCVAYTTPGICDEALHLFEATELRAGEQQLDADEAIEVREFTLEDALRTQLHDGPGDMKTLLALRWIAGRH